MSALFIFLNEFDDKKQENSFRVVVVITRTNIGAIKMFLPLGCKIKAYSFVTKSNQNHEHEKTLAYFHPIHKQNIQIKKNNNYISICAFN